MVLSRVIVLVLFVFQAVFSGMKSIPPIPPCVCDSNTIILGYIGLKLGGISV